MATSLVGARVPLAMPVAAMVLIALLVRIRTAIGVV